MLNLKIMNLIVDHWTILLEISGLGSFSQNIDLRELLLMHFQFDNKLSYLFV